VELTGVVWWRMWGPSRLRPTTTSTCNPRGLGGGASPRIKLHPHVGAVRRYRHLHMCEMS
jgi:hypothetical protein